MLLKLKGQACSSFLEDQKRRGKTICWLEFKIDQSQTASKLNPGLLLL